MYLKFTQKLFFFSVKNSYKITILALTSIKYVNIF